MSNPLEIITRLEVIDRDGRAFVLYLKEDEIPRYSLQDDDRTLKIFIDKEQGEADEL